METSGGTAMQGMSAAIVLNAIDKISGMINNADGAMQRAIDSEINAALHAIPGRPDTASASYREQFYSVQGALDDANLDGKDPDIDRMPLFLDNVVGSFFADYTDKLDALFPGLGQAGADADAFARAALASAMGMSYSEQVASTPAEPAFLLARRQAFAQEREALQTAAQAGHRFDAADARHRRGAGQCGGGDVSAASERGGKGQLIVVATGQRALVSQFG